METKNHVLSIISSINKKASAFIEKRLLENGIDDLLLPHGSILSVLFKNQNPLKISEITEKIKRTKSTVTESIIKLEKNGYVTKTPCDCDMRVTYIALTEKAYKLGPTLKSISQEMLSTFFKDFTEKEIDDYLVLNTRILNNFD